MTDLYWKDDEGNYHLERRAVSPVDDNRRGEILEKLGDHERRLMTLENLMTAYNEKVGHLMMAIQEIKELQRSEGDKISNKIGGLHQRISSIGTTFVVLALTLLGGFFLWFVQNMGRG